MNIDRPLDEVIQEKRKGRGPRRPRQPRAEGDAPAAAAAPSGPRQPRQPRNANQGAAAPAPAAAGGQVHVGDKVIISGLPDDVNEQQIRVRLPLSPSSLIFSD